MERIKTKINEKWVDENGILWMKVLDGAHIDLPSLIEDSEVNPILTGNKKALAIYDARGFYTMTDEATDYLRSGILNKTRIATAVITDNLGTRLIVNFISRIKKTDSPLKMFKCEETALAWLKTFKN